MSDLDEAASDVTSALKEGDGLQALLRLPSTSALPGRVSGAALYQYPVTVLDADSGMWCNPETGQRYITFGRIPPEGGCAIELREKGPNLWYGDK